MFLHAVDILDAETGGEDGNLDLLTQIGVEEYAPLELIVTVEVRHELIDLVHLLHTQSLVIGFVCGEGDTEQNLLGIVDVVVVEQRRVKRALDSFAQSALALAVTGTHDGHAAVFEHGAHVVEDEVDDASAGNDFGDALGSHAQRVVDLFPGVEHRQVCIYFAQPLVVDDQQSIYVLCQFLHTVEGSVDFLFAFQ